MWAPKRMSDNPTVQNRRRTVLARKFVLRRVGVARKPRVCNHDRSASALSLTCRPQLTKRSTEMPPKTKVRRRKPSITMAGPYAAKRVLDKKLWEEGRAKIASVALPLFAQYGYHATPVRAIADAAGLSVGSIFNYFPEKDEILRKILDDSLAEAERIVSETQALLAEGDSGRDPVDVFMGVYRKFVEFNDQFHRFTLLAYQETKSLTTDKRAPLLKRDQHIVEVLQAAAQPAIKAGIFSAASLELKVQSLIILGHAWAVRHWALGHYGNVGKYFEDLEKIVFAIMAARD